MEDRNRTLAKRIIEDVFSRGNIDDLESLVTSEIVIHDTDKELRGLEQVRQGIINLRTAFPDLQYTIEELLTDGDKVVARCKGAGTHKGVFRNIPATGEKMSYRVIFIWRFANGKLAEHWSVSDVYGMLQQLGVIQLKVQGNANL
jgi:steroid delta-isomerase-like uncharacterized protein